MLIWRWRRDIVDSNGGLASQEAGDRKVPESGQPPSKVFAMTDPRPLEDGVLVWHSAAQAAVIGIFVILLIAALSLARPLLLPVACSFIVGLMLGPLSTQAERYRVPNVLSALLLWLLVVVVFYGLIILLSTPVVEWIGKAPEIGETIKAKLHVLDHVIAAMENLRNAILPGDNNRLGFDLMSLVRPALTIVTPAVGQTLIFFGVLFFVLLGRTKMRHTLVRFSSEHEGRLRTLKVLNDIEHNLTNYLSIVTVINLCIGVMAGLVTYFVGLPNPVAWAVLGFILNFIPYIGALIMELVLFATGLVIFPSLTQAIIAPLLFLGFATLEGHFITPSIMGARLTLNPLTVFLSLVFWTWLWGPIGAFLAVPLLIIALVAIHHMLPRTAPALPG